MNFKQKFVPYISNMVVFGYLSRFSRKTDATNAISINFVVNIISCFLQGKKENILK